MFEFARILRNKEGSRRALTTSLISKSSCLDFLSSFEISLRNHLDFFSDTTQLRKACEYALLNGGKRVRPLITYIISEALGAKERPFDAALSLEFFHTASLIADDLPCMDNDNYRRDKPSTHKVFGETTALLASYALMAAGFEKISASCEKIVDSTKHEICSYLLKEVAIATGIKGATGGQYSDLFPKAINLSLLDEIIEKKTAMLFQVAFLYGWLFSGGSLLQAEEMKKLGFHFGFAFQIADDLQDSSQDVKKESPINIALFLGEEKAKIRMKKHIQEFCDLAQKHNLLTPAMLELLDKIERHAEEKKT